MHFIISCVIEINVLSLCYLPHIPANAMRYIHKQRPSLRTGMLKKLIVPRLHLTNTRNNSFSLIKTASEKIAKFAK